MSAPKNKKTDNKIDDNRKQQDKALNASMLFFALALITLLGIMHPFDLPLLEDFNKLMKYLLGKCHILLPALLFLFSGRMLMGIALGRLNASFISFMITLFFLPAIIHHMRIADHQELIPANLVHGGGIIGGGVVIVLRRTVGDIWTYVILIAGLAVAVALMVPWKQVFASRKKKDKFESYIQPSNNDTVKTPKPPRFVPKSRQKEREVQETTRKPSFNAAAPAPTVSQKPVRSNSPVQDVYKNDEFSSFTDGIKKENAFKRILNIGSNKQGAYTDEDVKEEIERDPIQIPEWEEEPKREPVFRPVINYGDAGTAMPKTRFLDPNSPVEQEPEHLEDNLAPRTVESKESAEPAQQEAKPYESIIFNPYHKMQKDLDVEQVAKAEPEKQSEEAKPAAAKADTAEKETEERPGFVIHKRKDEEAAAEAPAKTAVQDAVAAVNSTALKEQAKDIVSIAVENVVENKAAAAEVKPEAAVKPAEPAKPKYQFPPYELLAAPQHKDSAAGDAEIMQQCSILEQTLADFRVRANVVAATRGPAVTQFELQPAPGVKVNTVVNLADDIALRLAASGVRIEAPIPGKSAIGIEVPNLKTDPVSFREIVDSDIVRNHKSKLGVGLGKDISGDIITADIAKMPHLLIAGSTGSGKSVCINTIICGILYKALPEEVKLILVDPKVVELSVYNDIPHLLTPVVTDPKKAASALHWAVAEMERRYQLFADNHVRNIDGYNKDKEGADKVPYIVIIIDEMADLMTTVKADIETAIMRLAAKARAAGIHMILATQRPSVDVITGVLKNNIPSRIAFAVTSLIDSRTILDGAGAEKLLGKGDMLYNPYGSNKPVRVQGAFVSDEEVTEIVEFIKSQSLAVEYSDEVTSVELESDKKAAAAAAEEQGEPAGPTDDPLFEKALMLVLDTGQASASMMQRRFSIGFNRAARLVDTMSELGVVGKSMGSKPREVIMSRQEAEERFLNKD